ncbi:MAG: imidazole glycerol phosphate synthase subunit HisH [Armatimonadetes bacterium]|nr:imidazole glycerol phosphate synthase subunit HisH [Armatimonadota bacterium]
MTVVLDYGMGNLRSVQKAVEFLGHECRVQSDLRAADRIILPGVGAFGAAMERLGPCLADLKAAAAGGTPLLGICLGQQLLFQRSLEHGEHAGLGLLPGAVRPLRPSPGLKVPNIGWRPIHVLNDCPLLNGIGQRDQMYFVHSMYADTSDPSDVVATSSHGQEFAAAVRRDNVMGIQFHSEKSGKVGLRVLRNFLEC